MKQDIVETKGAISVDHNYDEDIKFSKVEKKSGKIVGSNYVIIKSFKESEKNDVFKCLYIKTLTKFGLCIIKEGTKGDTKDKSGRDIIDRLKWQKQAHQVLQGKVNIPRLLDSFESSGNYYLVIEYIKGKTLDAMCKMRRRTLPDELASGGVLAKRFMKYLLQIISILEKLHADNFTHRDITSSNFLINRRNKVFLIDMELSYHLLSETPSPPFELGTYGYMSPEQKTCQPPTVQDDIYSLGAVMLRIWTGISPLKVIDYSAIPVVNKLPFLIPDKTIADIIAKCLDPDPAKRPALQDIKLTVSKHLDSMPSGRIKATHNGNVPTEAIKNIIQETLNAFSTPLFSDEDGWFSEDINAHHKNDSNSPIKAHYASFNRGVGGILYLLGKAKRAGFSVEACRHQIEKATALIKKRYLNSSQQTLPGLHFGSYGLAPSLCTCLDNHILKEKHIYIDWIVRFLDKAPTELGVMNGAAGQGLAYLISRPYLADVLVYKQVSYIADHLLKHQQADGSWISHKKNRVKEKRPGFAHGIAGITYFLLEYGSLYTNEKAIQGAIKGLNWLIKNSTRKNNYIVWKSRSNKEIMPSWCEGAPGIAYTFIKAYQHLQDARYKKYALAALPEIDKNMLLNNLSQCHGLSGLGEVYLEAWKTFREDKWRMQAEYITHLILHLLKRDNHHGTYWLVQNERQPVASFMTGNSGVLHYLLRYCYSGTPYPLSTDC